MLFQIFLISFALFALYRVRKQYTLKQASRYWVVVWSVLWLGVIIVALVPNVTNVLAQFVGIGRGSDLLLYTAVMFLIYATYRGMVRQQKMSEEITELVRKIALDHPKRSENCE